MRILKPFKMNSIVNTNLYNSLCSINSGSNLLIEENPINKKPFIYFISKRNLLSLNFIILISIIFFSNFASSQIAQRGSSTSDDGQSVLVVNKPTGVISGDFLIASVSVNDFYGANIPTAPSGWTKIDGRILNTYKKSAAVFYKVATSSEPSSYSFGVAPGSGGGSYLRSMVQLTAFSGVDITNPFDVTPGIINVGQNAVNSISASSITTTSSNSAILLLGFESEYGYKFSNWSTTTSGSLTELIDVSTPTSGYMPWCSVGLSWGIQSTAGSTGTGTFSLSGANNSSGWGAMLLALKPACTIPNVTNLTGTFNVCRNSNYVYSVTNESGATYNWTLPVGWTGTSTSNSITTKSGSNAGNISVTLTNSCGTSSATVQAVTIKDGPTTVSAGSDRTICNGQSSTFSSPTASVSGSGSTILSESFNTGIPATWSKGTGWLTTYNNPDLVGKDWSNYGYSGYCAMFDSYYTSNGVSYDLVSPAMNLSSSSSVDLTFKIFNSDGADFLKVYVNNNGGSYTQIGSASYTTYSNWTTVTISLNSYCGAGNSAVRVKLTGTSDYGLSNIGIDDFLVSNSSPTLSYSWIPSTGLSSSSILSPSVNPTTTTTYILSATANSCSLSDTVVVNVNNPTLPAGNSIASGDLVWTGLNSNEFALASNWMLYNGSNYSTSVNLPSSSTNIIIPANGTCVLNSPSTSATIYTKDILNAGILTLNTNASLNVKGNFTNNGTLTANSNSTVTFNGTSAQTINGSANSTFDNLTVNNSFGLNIIKGITINSILTFTSGNIIAASSSDAVTFNTSATASGAADTKCIVGYCKKITNSTTKFTFPVGTTSLYRFASITPSSSSATTWTTKYYGAGYGSYNVIGSAIYQPSKREYWTIDRAGTSNATIELSWGSNSNVYVNNISDLIVAHYTGSAWESAGGNCISGSSTGVVSSNTNWSSFSPFTLGSQNYEVTLPISLVSFDVRPYQKGVRILWVTATEIESDYFTVERSENGKDFIEIGKLEAAGNSSHTINYSLVDDEFNHSILYYRLKLIDYSGNEKLSNILSIDMSQFQNFGTLVKTVNSLGQEVNEETKGIVFDIYSDGTTVKRFQF